MKSDKITYLSSGVLDKYSRSISPSIRFLIDCGSGMNRDFNCSVTSATILAKHNFFRDFIIRTIAASISCLRSSSIFDRVSRRSGSDSPFANTFFWKK